MAFNGEHKRCASHKLWRGHIPWQEKEKKPLRYRRDPETDEVCEEIHCARLPFDPLASFLPILYCVFSRSDKGVLIGFILVS